MHFYNVILLFFNALAKLIVIKSNSDQYQMFKCFKTEWCSVLQTFHNELPLGVFPLRWDVSVISPGKSNKQNFNFSLLYIQLLSLCVCYFFLSPVASSSALLCFLQTVFLDSILSLTHGRKAASPLSRHTFENVDLDFAACLCTINSNRCQVSSRLFLAEERRLAGLVRNAQRI